jgi:hypothetical protein
MVTNQYMLCEKCGCETLHRFGGLCSECERKKWNWRNFYRLIREYKTQKISEKRFVYEWAAEQKRQGITPQRGRFVRP